MSAQAWAHAKYPDITTADAKLAAEWSAKFGPSAPLFAEDPFIYKDALNELVRLQAEHHALNGGGPNWKERWAKALAYAEELVRVEP